MKPKILVVEDDIFHIEKMYKRPLSELNVEVEYAQSRLEAIEKIRCKTYDIAFVDIMLREDRRDRGGIEVIEYFDKLNEGTAIIVVSGTDDIKVSIKAFKTGVVDFIQKEEVRKKEDIILAVQRILDNYKLYKKNPFGRFISLSAYLASPELTPYWESAITRTLGVNFQLMVSILNNSLEKYLPILRIKNSVESMITDSKKQCIHGTFWSKGIGYPIWYSLANEEGTLVIPPEEIRGDCLKKSKKGALIFSIWKLFDTKRNDYCESVWDEQS